MQSCTVVGGISSWCALRDESSKGGLAFWFSIVMGAGSAAQQAKPVVNTAIASV